jgi:hypothetical protein
MFKGWLFIPGDGVEVRKTKIGIFPVSIVREHDYIATDVYATHRE